MGRESPIKPYSPPKGSARYDMSIAQATEVNSLKRRLARDGILLEHKEVVEWGLVVDLNDRVMEYKTKEAGGCKRGDYKPNPAL